MLQRVSDSTSGHAESFEIVEGPVTSRYILVCDHASNAIPPEYGDLGLDPVQLERHIAYDIGAAALTRRLANEMAAPAVLSRFSRLLIDPNRGDDDPTLVMKISDGAIVAGNAKADDAEVARRIARFSAPYHAAIDRMIDRSLAAGVSPILFSIHSFTPLFHDGPRPWHCSVLWEKDGRFALPLLEALRAEPDIVTGENEPYAGALKGDSMTRHGFDRGLPHAIAEVRQDLLDDESEISAWVTRFSRILTGLTVK
ncbi:MAG: N-formylglutamate amidohydrolase [Rhizobiales bacterium]|jgi:predicted N-formylglutamate amidohydrolase|nr:N-formylglutamate amidohydrolase [Hyphomicrobiales bacterium]